jgi:hypothetical protein
MYLLETYDESVIEMQSISNAAFEKRVLRLIFETAKCCVAIFFKSGACIGIPACARMRMA